MSLDVLFVTEMNVFPLICVKTFVLWTCGSCFRRSPLIIQASALQISARGRFIVVDFSDTKSYSTASEWSD